MTLPEILLWGALRQKRFEGLHVRRQHPIGPYVLDFYCDKVRLCIEVDGEVHSFADRPTRDGLRDEWLRARQIRTVRLPAGLVLSDLDSALDTIRQALTEEPPPPLRGPPPSTREDR